MSLSIAEIQALWLDEPLAEEQVSEASLPKGMQGKNLNLVVRELSADEAGDILDACTDQKTQKLNQKKFMGMVVVNSLRDGSNPDRPLVWDITFMQSLLKKGIRPILKVATQSIALSGLSDQLTSAEKNGSEPTPADASPSA